MSTLRTLLCVVATVALNSISIAQCGNNFGRVVAGSSGDYGHGTLIMPNGDIIVSGHTQSFGSTGHDLFLMRMTMAGDVIWMNRYHFAVDDGGRSIGLALCQNGDILVAGQIYSISNSVNGTEQSLIARFDGNGVLLWARSFDASGYWHARDVKEAANGDVIFCGSENGISMGAVEAFVGRMTSAGTLLWIKIYGGSGNDHWTGINEEPNGDIVLVSSTQSVGTGNRRAWFARTDANGSLQTGRAYAATSDDMFVRTIRNSDGTYLNVGWTQSYGTGIPNIMAILTDVNGLVIWSTVFASPGFDIGLNAVQTSDQGWAIGGQVDSEVGLIKLDASGVMQWANLYPDMSIPYTGLWGNVVSITSTGNFILSGNGTGVHADDAYIQMTDSCGNACGSVPWAVTQIFPNISSVLFAPSQTGTLNVVANQSSSTSVISVSTPGVILDICTIVCTVQLQQASLSACVNEPVIIDPTVTMTSGTATTWQWDLGDGTTLSGVDSVVHLYTSPGNYIVTIIAGDAGQSCMDTLLVDVEIGEPGDAGLDGLIRACPNAGGVELFMQLGGAPDSGGTWYGPGGVPFTGWWDPSLNPTGFYQYVVPASGVCADTAQVFVDLFPGANAGLDSTLVICNSAGLVDLNLMLSPSSSGVGAWYDPVGTNMVTAIVDAGTGLSGDYLYVDMTQFCSDTAIYSITFDICSALSSVSGAECATNAWVGAGQVSIQLDPVCASAAELTWSMHDAAGRAVAVMDLRMLTSSTVRIGTAGLPPGAYLISGTAPAKRLTWRLVLVE